MSLDRPPPEDTATVVITARDGTDPHEFVAIAAFLLLDLDGHISTSIAPYVDPASFAQALYRLASTLAASSDVRAESAQSSDTTRSNGIDPVTRAEMAALDTFPAEHWTNLYNGLVSSACLDFALASTAMAHLSHAEARCVLAFLVGHDAQAAS